MSDRWNILYIENGKRYPTYRRWYSDFDYTICQGPYATLDDLETIKERNEAKDWLVDPPEAVAAIVDVDQFEIGICCEWWATGFALDSCLQRELYMQWLAILWHGWKVRWLENGQYELFARCGLPFSPEFERRPLKSAPFQQTEGFSYGLLTIRNEDGSLQDYKSKHPLQMVLRGGRGFLKQQAFWKPTTVEAWPKTAACNTKVTHGDASHVFIDLQAKSIQLHPAENRGYSTWDPLLLPTLERVWRGWTISIYCGNRQQHLLRTGRDAGPGALGAIDIALCKLATRFIFLRESPDAYRLLDPVATAAERGFPDYDINEFQKLLPVTQCPVSEREEIMVRAICIFYNRLQRGEYGSLRWPGCQCAECDALRARWKVAVENKQRYLE